MDRRSKRKIGGLLCFAVLLSALWYAFIYEPPYNGLVHPSGKTLVFAHRGFGNYAPDNSLAGALLAFRAGMDGVDMDGQMSSDGEFVIFHDLSVDRLTDSTGKVNDLPLTKLLTLDLGSKFGHGFKRTYVATFEDFVSRINGKGILMVELKVPGLQNTGIEKKAVDIIKKYHAEESVYLSSFNPLVLYRLKKLDPNIRTVLIFMDTNWNPQLLAEIKPEDLVNLPWVLRQEWIRRAIRKIIRPDLLSVNKEVSEKTIDTVIRKGYPIFLWTPEDENDIKFALSKKPYGVISDEPKLAKRLRDSLPDAP